MGKTATLALLLALLVCIAIVIANWPWRWILIHGWGASKHADQLLSGQPSSDSSFIDYTIYTADGCVVFAQHEADDRTMVYCPKGLPGLSEQVGPLKHVVSSWYRAD